MGKTPFPWRRTFLLGLVASCLFAAMAQVRTAQGEGELKISVVSVDDSDFPKTTIVLQVERDGRPLPGESADSIIVTDNGVVATNVAVKQVSDANLPATIVAALDVSGSMMGEKLTQAKTSLAALVSDLGATDQATLITFADRAQLVTPVGADQSALLQAINSLNAGGNTALYSAVAESARVTLTPGSGRKIVVLLTDGEEYGNLSGVSRTDSLELARSSGALFYVLGLAGSDHQYLRDLAAVTRGKFISIDSTQQVQAGFQEISNSLKGQLVVTFESGADATPLTRTIEISVASEAARGETTYRFTSSRILAVPTPNAAPKPIVQAPVILPSSIPMTTSESHSKDNFPSGVAVVVVLLVGIISATSLGVFRHFRKSANMITNPEIDDVNFPNSLTTSMGQKSLIAVLRDVSTGHSGQEYAIPSQPVHIGSADDAIVHIPPGRNISGYHSRLWWRDGALMLHHVGEMGTTTVNGKSVDWVSLSSGDLISIGDKTFALNISAANPRANDCEMISALEADSSSVVGTARMENKAFVRKDDPEAANGNL